MFGFAADYLVAQRAYMGWNLSAILVLGAVVSTGLFAWHARNNPGIFTLAVVACRDDPGARP